MIRWYRDTHIFLLGFTISFFFPLPVAGLSQDLLSSVYPRGASCSVSLSPSDEDSSDKYNIFKAVSQEKIIQMLCRVTLMYHTSPTIRQGGSQYWWFMRLWTTRNLYSWVYERLSLEILIHVEPYWHSDFVDSMSRFFDWAKETDFLSDRLSEQNCSWLFLDKISHITRKPVFAICEHRSLISAFVVRCLDSIISLLARAEISTS